MIAMKRFILSTFIYSDLFISFCALAMAWETGYVLQYSIDRPILLLIFFATLASYIFHSLVNLVYPANSERRTWNARHKYLLGSIFILASISLFYFIIPFWKNPFPLIVGGFFTFLYSAPNLPGKFPEGLKKIAYGKTAYLALMWTYATTFLPLLLLNISLEKQTWLFFGYRFFLIYAICILFDRRDIEEDKIKGIRALPTVLQEKPVQWLYFSSLLMSMFFWILMRNTLWALIIPILILIPLLKYSKHNRSDWLYYVCLDGLMALSAFLHASLFG